ncbi:MAG: phage holin family protein [Pseudomonadota bacterium]
MQDEHGPLVRLILAGVENIQYLGLLIIAMWGGTAAYLKTISKKGEVFSVRAWIGECSISGFTGLMAMYYCQYAEFSAPVTGIVTGVAGLMSGKLISRLEDVGNELFNRYFPKKTPSRPENES